jgi:hypothetical protein
MTESPDEAALTNVGGSSHCVVTFDWQTTLDNTVQGCYIAASRVAFLIASLSEAAMSLVVKLEDDLGERSEWVILNGVLPDSVNGDFALLDGIDPFGKTVFNHLQMAAFLKDWDRVKDRVRDDTQREAWTKVKSMAELCRDDRDLYLRFVGN